MTNETKTGPPQSIEDMPVKYHRDQVIKKLKDHFAADHLEVEEFEFLLKIANETKSKKELMSLTADLPDVGETALPALPQEKQPPIAVNAQLIRHEERIAAVFSTQERKGTWSPAKYSKVSSVFGSCKLDYTKALLVPDESTVHANAVFGEVHIWVPPGVNVDVSGVGIMGEFTDKTDGMIYQGAPTIKIEGFAVFGEVKVRVKTDKPGFFAQLLDRLGFRG